MARTSPIITFGAYDALGMKQDSSVSCNVALQTWSKLNDLKLHGVFNTYPYATFEPDYWMLDGSFKIKPADETNIHAGIMGTVQSNSAGVFVSAPVLTVTFGSVHSTDGLILQFDGYSGDWCNSITVAYYDASNVLIRSDNYAPSAALFSAAQVVANFKKIIITFNSMNKPYRYFRLLDIDYTLGTYFSGTEIKSCNVVEEINPPAVELPFDTCDFRLFSDNPQLSIMVPAGGYTLLQNRQPVYIYEQVNNTVFFMGKFFIDKWENLSEKEISIHAIDQIGILDTVKYIGAWPSYIDTATTFLAMSLGVAGYSYALDASLAGARVEGLLLSGTYRNALHQMCLAIGAYATCSRSSTINILPIELASNISTQDFTITKSEKSISQSLTLKPFVTGVEVVSHNYGLDDVKTRYIYGPTYVTAPATLVIQFSEVVYSGWSGTVTGATVVSYDNINYILTLSVTVDGNVSVTVPEMNDVTTLKGIYNGALPVGAEKNIFKVANGVFIGTSILDVTTQRLYDYYQQRYAQKTRLYASQISVGNSVLIDSLSGYRIIGVAEKVNINLSGGFIVDAQIVGDAIANSPIVNERNTGINSGGTPQATISASVQVDSHLNRLLIVFISVRAYHFVTSITYGSQIFTLLQSEQYSTGNNPRIEMWYLVAPTVGTANVTINLTGADYVEASVLGFYNVLQSSSFRSWASGNGARTPASVYPVENASNDLVIDGIAYFGATATPLGTGHTTLATITSDGTWKLSVGQKAGGGSASLAWTVPSAWAHIAAAIKVG